MVRAPCFQYPGAIYHVTARGDGGKTVCEKKDDCEVFLHCLGEACGSCGWRVHAWEWDIRDRSAVCWVR